MRIDWLILLLFRSRYHYIPRFTGIFRELPLTRLGFGRLVPTKVQDAEPSTSSMALAKQKKDGTALHDEYICPR
ncbi:hypothetical protein BJX64DRAFT_129871 [Aspergillus heterothallicus]